MADAFLLKNRGCLNFMEFGMTAFKINHKNTRTTSIVASMVS